MTVPAEPVIPIAWPKFITAGTSFKVDRMFENYGTPGWQLSVVFAGLFVTSFNTTPQITADPDGETWHIVLAPADTQPLNPGGGASLPYTVVERLTGTDGEVYDVSVQKLMISPNIALANPGDYQTNEEKDLAAAQAALTTRIAGGMVENYSIAGRSISKLSIPQLRQLIGGLKWLVYRQRNPGRIGIPGEFEFRPTDTSQLFPWKPEDV